MYICIYIKFGFPRKKQGKGLPLGLFACFR